MPKIKQPPKRGPGRPPLTVPSSILYMRIHGDVLSKLSKASKRGKRTFAAVVRGLIEDHL